MGLVDVLIFLAAGIVGGAANAAAGGAKLFVFPLLLAGGLPPVAANATSTVGVWPAQAPAIWVYRDRLSRSFRDNLALILPTLVGALAGVAALMASGDALFSALVPPLLLLASIAIAFGDRIAKLAASGRGAGPVSRTLLLFLVGVYGGYFGAGVGFMLLAVLTFAGSTDMHDANARKNLISTAMNTTAVVPLAFSGLVSWPAALLVAAGGIAGGYLGARLVRLVSAKRLRLIVAVCGIGLTIVFFAQ